MPKKKKATKLHPVTAYAQAVLDGEIVTGRLVKLACQRHMRDLKDGHKRGLRFDQELADHFIDFCPKFLKHNEGRFADQPFVLSASQMFIWGSVFGWLKTNGYRRFRHVYWEESKGGGKTPAASAAAIYVLTMDDEQGAEIYTAAVTRDQAGIAFKDCKHMAEKSEFADRLIITEHNIAYPATNSFIRSVSSEANSLDGKRVAFVILDEVHEHRTPLVIDKMVAGNKGRMQPLNVRVTNSGWDRTSVCWSEHEYSREVLEQIREDDDWFAYVCQLDPCEKCLSEGKSSPQDECKECDHWWDEKTWIKANPNLDISVTSDYLRGEVKKALAISSKALTVKRLNFSIWTENISHWLPMDEWDLCGFPKGTEEVRAIAAAMGGFDFHPNKLREYLKGRRCFGGVDLADTTDTASFVLIFPPAKTKLVDVVSKELDKEIHTVELDVDAIEEPFIILPWVWIPEDMDKRTGKERERFKAWVSKDMIEATPGNSIDYRYILKTIAQCRIDYDLQAVAFDPSGSRGIITDLCADYGFTQDAKEAERFRKPWITHFDQSHRSFAPPTKDFSRLVIKHKILHARHPLMRWFVGNVVLELDPYSNPKPHKGKSTEKIDGAIAAVMALDFALKMPAKGGSVYEDRGLLVL